jgi:hypothetical protein
LSKSLIAVLADFTCEFSSSSRSAGPIAKKATSDPETNADVRRSTTKIIQPMIIGAVCEGSITSNKCCRGISKFS